MAETIACKKIVKLDLLNDPFHITYRKRGQDLLIKRYEVEVVIVTFRDAPRDIRAKVYVVIWDHENVSVFREHLKTFEERESIIDALIIGSTHAINCMYAASNI
jgi:hypothetical protein